MIIVDDTFNNQSFINFLIENYVIEVEIFLKKIIGQIHFVKNICCCLMNWNQTEIVEVLCDE